MADKIPKKQEKLVMFISILAVIAILGFLFYLVDPFEWYGEDAGNENTCISATVENGRFDVNGDGNVDLVDMVDLGDQYTISPYNNGYDVTYDLNCDKSIDEIDMQLLSDVVYG